MNSLCKNHFYYLSVFFFGCSEAPERIESKLHPYLQEDLKFMVAELKRNGTKEDLLDTPYYVVKDFRLFEGASVRYSQRAEVDFYL